MPEIDGVNAMDEASQVNATITPETALGALQGRALQMRAAVWGFLLSTGQRRGGGGAALVPAPERGSTGAPLHTLRRLNQG